MPLWNPLVGMGAPLVANYQSGLFYPPNWLYFLLAAFAGPAGLAWGQGWLVVAHLTWAALGMGLLARRLGLGVLAQTLSGLAFGLSGYLVARAGFLSINAAVAWLPWVILGLTRRQSGLGNVLYLSLCFGMLFLAGHAQTAWYILLLAAGWSASWVSRSLEPALRNLKDRPTRESLKLLPIEVARWAVQAWGPLAIAACLGAMLAAVQLLPTAEYLMESQRAAAVDYESAMTYSFWPWRILGLAAPGIYGSPASGDYWGYGNFWEDAIYIGLLPLALAVSLVWRRRTGMEEARIRQADGPGTPVIIIFLFLTVVISLVLALGDNLPVFPWLYRNVPSFDMFQSPARFSLWAVFSLALLAGIGAQFWRRPTGRGLYWTRLGTAAAAAVSFGAGITSLAAPMGLEQVNPTTIRAVGLAGLWGLGIGFLALSNPAGDPGSAGRGWWTWAVASLVAVDLIVAGWGLNPAVEVEVYQRELPVEEQVRSRVGDGRIYLPADDEEQLKFQRFLRFDTFSNGESWAGMRAALLPDVNMLAGIASVNNFDPLVPGRYARWMEALETAGEPARERMLDQMAVTVVERVDPASPGGIRFEPRTALPRVRWAGCGLGANSAEEALEWVMQGNVQIDREVVLETGPGSLSTPCVPGEESPAATLEVLNENPNRLSVVLQASEPGYLVLADVWFPGWQARIDGNPALVLRANYLFRAVSIPAGKHQIDWIYRPASFYLGALVSTLAWAGVAILFILIARAGQPVLSRQSSIL
jgi:hypothetical protein